MDSKYVEALKIAQDAIAEVLAENAKLKRTLVELDTGGGNYLTVRKVIAELSGVPSMAISFDEHIKIIKEKLANTPSPTERME
jgi:hypothetical protein